MVLDKNQKINKFRLNVPVDKHTLEYAIHNICQQAMVDCHAILDIYPMASYKILQVSIS